LATGFFETILATYGFKYGEIWKFFFRQSDTNSALKFVLWSFSLNELVLSILHANEMQLVKGFYQELGVFLTSFSDFTQFS